MSGMLSVKGAAEHLGLGRSAVYALVASGDLACYKIGPNRGRIRFKPSDLDAYLEGMRVGPKVRARVTPPRPKVKYDHGF